MDNTTQAAVDQDPPHGGSYVRNPDGSLTRTEGPALDTPVDTPADPANQTEGVR